MRRLALLAAAVLAVAVGTAARAEPLDVDLSRLGPPNASVWTLVNGSATGAEQLAQDARTRFALLSSQVALALSSAILQPASTTGLTGFAVDLETAALGISRQTVGAPTAGFTNQVWPTGSSQPSALYIPSVHVRKGLPFSFEVGGRLIYLASSNAYAAQGEGKWALNEGFQYVPDVALRVAYTRLFGVKDWNLSTTDLDLLISKRFGIMGVTSLTPYLVGRLSWVSASSARIDFAPALEASPTDTSGQASFPTFAVTLYRTTVGVRFTASAVSLALEGTYFAGADRSARQYDGFTLPSSLTGAAKLGWEW